MRMKGDITDVSPLIDDSHLFMVNDLISHLFMVNDLIFTSAGELDKVVVTKTGGSGFTGFNGVSDEWEHGDNVEW